MFQEEGLWEWDFSDFETAGSHFCLLSSAFGSLSSPPLCTKISYALSRISQITVESYVRVADELSPRPFQATQAEQQPKAFRALPFACQHDDATNPQNPNQQKHWQCASRSERPTEKDNRLHAQRFIKDCTATVVASTITTLARRPWRDRTVLRVCLVRVTLGKMANMFTMANKFKRFTFDYDR